MNYYRNELNNFLDQNFSFYYAHHRHPINIIIHYITIPLIIWTILILLAYATLYNWTDDAANYMLALNGSVPIILAYLILYYLLDWHVGIFFTIIIFILYLFANYFTYSDNYAWLYAIIIHIISWSVQILSHRYIEGNRHSISDNMVQGLIMGPLYIVYHFMFLLGYKLEYRKKISVMAEEYKPLYK